MNELSIGELLRKAREQKGKTLSEIAQTTRIAIPSLEALERGDFAFLPQPYVRLYLRAYAEQISIDPEEVIRQYEMTVTGSTPPPDLSPKYHPIMTEMRIPWRYIVMIGSGIGVIIVAVAIVVALYRFIGQTPPSREDLISSSSSVPDTGRVSVMGQQPDTAVSLSALEQTVTSQISRGDTGLFHDTLQVSLIGQQPDTLALLPHAERATTSEVSSGDTVASDDVVVRVEAKKQVWIEVYTVKDTLFYDLLAGGEQRTWRDRSGIELKVGNWANVVLSVAGKPVEGIEPTAQIVKLTVTKAGTERRVERGWKLHKGSLRETGQ